MFIEIAELNTVLYQYQLDQITEEDNDIALQNIAAAETEVRSYLAALYDVDTIFSQTGTSRNALILELTKNIALWYIVRLSNVDIIYQQAKDKYDRAIAYLKQVAAGEVMPSLPNATDANGDVATTFKFGSNKKFNHQY